MDGEWTRRPKLSVIQRPQAVESPKEGGKVRCAFGRPCGTNGGDSSVALLPLNDVCSSDCAAGCGGNVDAGPHHFRHSEGYAVPRGIPNGGAERYVIVSLVEPTGGLRRRKVRSTPLPPCGESFSHSLAPPFRTRSASLGSRPRRGQRSARMTAIFKLRSLRMTYETAKNNTVKKSKGV